MKTYRIALLVSVLGCLTPALFAQATGPGPRAPAKEGQGSAQSEAVRALLAEFQAKRQQFIAQRRELVSRLQNLSEEERKAILAQLRAEQQGRTEEQRALAKEIRDEMRRLREARRPNG